MERYDYYDAVASDIKRELNSTLDVENGIATYCGYEYELEDEFDNLVEIITDDMWESDSVTGNASGSYYCNSYKAEEALCHNTELIRDVAREFSIDLNDVSPETLDVSIRCYIVSEIIHKIVYNFCN